MLFHYKPKEAIVQNIKNKQTDKISRHLVCVFDAEGQLETEDPKIIYILQNKIPGCTWDGEEVKAEEVKEILDDTEIRQLAKAKGISHWHNKSIDRLKKELEAL